MHRPLQSNTFFRGMLWAFCLLSLFSCEPWRLPKRECYPANAQGVSITPPQQPGQPHTISLVNPTGTIRNVIWEFGDGTPPQTTTQTTTTHQYQRAGSFMVKATLNGVCSQAKEFPPQQATIPYSVSTVGASPGIGNTIITGIRYNILPATTPTEHGVYYAVGRNPTTSDQRVPAPVGNLSAGVTVVTIPALSAEQEGQVVHIQAYSVINGQPVPNINVVTYTIPVATGLVAHYNFTDNAVDSTINRNNGRPMGAASFTYGTDRKRGTPNGSLSLNASSAFFEAPDSESLNSVQQLTVSFWFRATQFPATNGQMQFFYKGRWDNPQFGGEQYSSKIGRLGGGALNITGDAKKDGGCQNGGSGWRTANQTTPNVTLNTWHHVAVVFDGVEGRVYVDGREGEVKPSLIGAIDRCTGGPLRIGAQISEDPDRFIGQIDDFRIYNRGLNAAQRQYLQSE